MEAHVIGLNLGSGQRPFDKPWINVDCQEKWKPDVLADIRDMPMFKDSSIDLVIAWHVIEHFGLGEADGVIKESFRVLKHGGTFIVATPDLKALAQRWLSKEIDDYTYTVNLMGAYMEDEADRHKWNWSQEGLFQYIGRLAPWKSVERFNGPAPTGTDISVDWWMATAIATK